MSTPVAQSIYVSAQGLQLHALERNPSGQPVVVFLHGWLDHAQSFDWLCDALPATWRQIAMDFRGMGRSAHLTGGGLYNFTDYLADVNALVEHVGAGVHLVGHSLGGSVALVYAAARPDRVLSLTSIESLGPSGLPPENAPLRLQRFISDLRKPSLKRTYPTVEAAVDRVRGNNSSLSAEAALHLARHGLQPVSGGFQFSFDPAHRKYFGMVFDEQQLLAILSSVRCTVQVIRGSAGFTFDDAQMKARLARLGSPVPVTVTGGHHVHLDRPSEVAQYIEQFVRKTKTHP
jgi:pimeloyl-ACP methyl ester carboxylesterase